MITPPVGVNPMLVSIDLPPLTAVTLAPFAEMGNYQAVRQIVPKLVHDRFARKAVKPVALDTLQLQFLGDRKDACDIRQFGVRFSECCNMRRACPRWERLAGSGIIAPRRSYSAHLHRDRGAPLKAFFNTIIEIAPKHRASC